MIIHAELSWGGGILMWTQAKWEHSSLFLSSPLFDDRVSPAPDLGSVVAVTVIFYPAFY